MEWQYTDPSSDQLPTMDFVLTKNLGSSQFYCNILISMENTKFLFCLVEKGRGLKLVPVINIIGTSWTKCLPYKMFIRRWF